MSKKKTIIDSVNGLFDDIKQTINTSDYSVSGDIPDIIEFCESSDYLGLSHLANPVNLRPIQKIILKIFYRGSHGNEDIQLTEDEIDICKKLQLVDENRGDLLSKYNNKSIFRELVLVWGRRGGKDFCGSIIALYETMKLIEMGNPYERYNISESAPIGILTVANSKDQAKIAFREIREKLVFSKYFKDKIGPDGIESNCIWLQTPKDKQDAKEFKEQGKPLVKKGSILIQVGHSNSDSLLGSGVFVLILDEVASYKHTGGASSGERILAALQPSLTTYAVKKDKFDDDGNLLYKKDENTGELVPDTETVY